MNILVFVKPIRTNLIYPNENRREEYTMNPYDLLCVQKLIQLKQKANIHITCISMGVSAARQILVRCIALGCDKGILLNDKEYFAGSDTYATSNILAYAAKKVGYDCIVCGKKSVDGETGQVKYGIAELLKVRHYNNVIEIEELDKTSLTLKVDKDEEVELIKVEMPAMLSFQEFSMIHEELSLFRLKEAGRKNLTVWNAKDIQIEEDICGSYGSKTVVSKVTAISQNRNGVTIRGGIKEQIHFLKKLITANVNS